MTLCIPEGFCVAIPDGVSAQPVRLPTPLGMPRVVGKRMFPLAQRLGLNRRVSMTCFDNVLWLTGNTNERYLETAVRQLRGIIREGRFEAVYSEFNVAAIIAAKVEGVPVFGTTSYPTQPSYASDPATANGVNRVLRSLSMGEVRSPEDVLLMPQVRFVPSCHALEPFSDDDSVIFTGPFAACRRRCLKSAGMWSWPTSATGPLHPVELAPCLRRHCGTAASSYMSPNCPKASRKA